MNELSIREGNPGHQSRRSDPNYVGVVVFRGTEPITTVNLVFHYFATSWFPGSLEWDSIQSHALAFSAQYVESFLIDEALALTERSNEVVVEGGFGGRDCWHRNSPSIRPDRTGPIRSRFTKPSTSCPRLRDRFWIECA